MRLSPPTAILAAGLLLAGCGEVLGPRPHEPWRPVQLDERVVNAYTGFGLDLFAALVAAEPDQNVFVSPTSAAFALALAYNGAVGETAQEMARTLGVEGIELDEFNRANRAWLQALATTGDRDVELAVANSIWIRQGFPVVPEFVDRTRSHYDAEVQERAFDQAAVQAINAWAKQATRGHIEQILDGIPGDVVMYLINALYFKGDWSHPFDRRQTRQEPFTLPDGTRKDVPMMTQNRRFPVYFGEGFALLRLPYSTGRFSMVLALPDEGVGLAGFYAMLEPAAWKEWLGRMEEGNVYVSLPRFELEWESSLSEVLQGLGMQRAFDGALADFSAMSPARPWIGDVKQKTIVEVNEEGTVAAAVTTIPMVTSMPPELRFDRPFFFVIHDHATDTMLFLGQVVDPS